MAPYSPPLIPHFRNVRLALDGKRGMRAEVSPTCWQTRLAARIGAWSDKNQFGRIDISSERDRPAYRLRITPKAAANREAAPC